MRLSVGSYKGFVRAWKFFSGLAFQVLQGSHRGLRLVLEASYKGFRRA